MLWCVLVEDTPKYKALSSRFHVMCSLQQLMVKTSSGMPFIHAGMPAQERMCRMYSSAGAGASRIQSWAQCAPKEREKLSEEREIFSENLFSVSLLIQQQKCSVLKKQIFLQCRRHTFCREVRQEELDFERKEFSRQCCYHAFSVGRSRQVCRRTLCAGQEF